MAAGFSLKDHLFNVDTVGQLAREYAAVLPDFDTYGFVRDCLAGFDTRELMDRLDWIADQVGVRLAADFPTMADQIEAALPVPLDPTLKDDDFGHFIHAVPGILAVRHGMDHLDRALDLLRSATMRFSMEYYIRPFLNMHPKATLVRLHEWSRDENYHVRRLVSEGTRARLPWAKRIDLDPLVPVAFLDILHADSTRYVTRSVANHLNDIAKFNPDLVLDRLAAWRAEGQQTPKELAWMTRHALRTLIKDGHPGAMELLGYRADADVTLAELKVTPAAVRIGDALEISLTLSAPADEPVIVDYVLYLRKANGELAPKVFKLKDTAVKAGSGLVLKKTHKFKANATTFTLYPGPQRVEIQVNGRAVGAVSFDLI
ncbi:MAG: DNA alkylation repair protein [Planktomarina sp.]